MTTIVDHNGFLAIKHPASPDFEKPESVTTLYVSNIPTADYPYLVEAIVNDHSWQGNICHVTRRDGGSSLVDATGWRQIEERAPIKKPGRGGKDWRWTWQWGSWRKTFDMGNVTDGC